MYVSGCQHCFLRNRVITESGQSRQFVDWRGDKDNQPCEGYLGKWEPPRRAVRRFWLSAPRYQSKTCRSLNSFLSNKLCLCTFYTVNLIIAYNFRCVYIVLRYNSRSVPMEVDVAECKFSIPLCICGLVNNSLNLKFILISYFIFQMGESNYHTM